MTSARTDLWIFGYGSLVWRPDFDAVEVVPAWSRGYERRFWQSSTDHRGTPEHPGRVVTLIPRRGVRCRGLAYRIDPLARRDVLTYLDHREKNGYLRRGVQLALDDGRSILATTYIADPEGIHFVGPASFEQVVEQIRAASGPSGSNTEYVVRLADALRALGVHDEEVHRLADALHDDM